MAGMTKGKLKKAEKKHFSIALIPHSSNRIKVLNFAYMNGKIIAISLIIFLTAASVYLLLAKSENRALRQTFNNLSSVNAQQLKQLNEKTTELSSIKGTQTALNQNLTAKIDDFTHKFNQITDKYIAVKTSSKSSRGGTRGDATFSDALGDLKSVLENLGKLNTGVGESVLDLSDAEKKLETYMQSIPTFWPLKGKVGNGFGYRRDPFTGKRAFHEGVDISASTGTSIKAAAAGKVILAERYSGYGLAVIIDHDHGLTTLYAHSSKILVKKGQTVKKGDIIAKVGSTGRSTGPHLHFEVRLHGSQVDPLLYLNSK